MPLVVKDRVKETTTTAGTGTVTLAGAVSGYQSFSVIGNGNTTYYAIVGETEWEVGIGTYTSSGTTLSRDTVLESSTGGSKVDFAAGDKDVFCTYPAERSVDTELIQSLNNKTLESPTITGNTTINAQGDLRFADADSSNYVAFQAPATVTANVLWTLPAADGSANQVLKTDGSGNLGWASAGTVTSVDVSGGTTGLTTSGGPVTSSGTVTIAGTLNVANGGTGATTLTSNNVILGNGTSAVQFVAPGSSGNVLTSNGSTWTSEASVSGGNATANVGYLNIPQNSQSTAYTLVLADSGKHILHPSADTTARTFTIPANSSVAFPIGTAVTFVNQDSAGSVTIAITTDTMRLAGAGTTGSRTLAANGVATAIKLTSTEWIISGTGLT